MDSTSAILISLAAVFAAVAIIHVSYVLYRTGKPRPHKSWKPMSSLIVLVSGGHTAEMMNILLELQKDWFKPRYYVAATTDNMSLQKARVLEDSVVETGNKGVGAQFMQIYRSREVGQSYVTSVGTTLIDMILCNGPGTCVPLCVIAFLFKYLSDGELHERKQ